MVDYAPIDCLTGFYLRDTLNSFLENLIVADNAQKKHFTLALVDLDHFKKFNDKFGHAFGDEILRYTSATLRLTLGGTQCRFFRYGGDEFIIVFPDKTPKETSHLLQQCFHKFQHRPFLFNNKLYKITASCGVAGFPAKTHNPEELIRMADAAMYYSKRRGRNRITLNNNIIYLKIFGAVSIIFIASVTMLFFLLAYHMNLRKWIQPVFVKMQKVIMKTADKGIAHLEPKTTDTILFKNGNVIKGYIIYETSDKVTIALGLASGQGAITFDKNEIAQIKYAGSK